MPLPAAIANTIFLINLYTFSLVEFDTRLTAADCRLLTIYEKFRISFLYTICHSIHKAAVMDFSKTSFTS